MESSRFDTVARVLARRMSRRGAVVSGGLGLGVAAVGLNRVAAQDATPPASGTGTPTATDADEQDSTLFVQTATSGTFTPNPNAGMPLASATPVLMNEQGTPTPAVGGDYLLTLHGHAGETIAFSDRPERYFGEVKTPDFLAKLGFDPANPPNAAIVADTAEGEDDVLVVELLNPAYDAANQTLTYDANILGGYAGEGLAPVASRQQDQEMAAEFSTASLFIDSCPNTTLYCFTAADVALCAPRGPVYGIGTCWHWDCVCCDLCHGSPGDYCASAYPNDCGDGNCTGMTFSEFTQVCSPQPG